MHDILTKWRFVLITVATASAIAALVVFASRGGSNGALVSAPPTKGTVPSPTNVATAAPSCATDLNVVVADARFVAFDGALRPHAGGKLLVVLLEAVDHGPSAETLTSDKFKLVDVQRNEYDAIPAPSTVSAGQTAGSAALRLAFDVPRPLGTATLVYQAGCGARNWDVP